MSHPADDPRAALLELYEQALPRVFGYLVSRGGSVAVAEDLTAETFLAAVTAVHDGTAGDLTPAWLLAVARNKLVDHWRREGREQRSLRAVATEPVPAADDPWDVRLDALRARQVLGTLGPHHRAALTLRYLDGLSVPEVATHLQRTVHATEALLVRARSAFRRAYGDEGRASIPGDGSRRSRRGGNNTASKEWNEPGIDHQHGPPERDREEDA